VVLGQTKLLERCTCSNLDLCGYDVDTSDLLGDGVLDLDTGVDLPMESAYVYRSVERGLYFNKIIPILR
jgi:hypothetical protein